MIFVTIGTQAPFDRLIRAMDIVASQLNGEKVIAQSFGSNYSPKHMEIIEFISPNEYNDLLAQARLIVSHAGVGSILSALTMSKPIIVMPRKASLGEHRNEHQIATAREFANLGYIYLADDEIDLKYNIELIEEQNIKNTEHFNKEASADLILSIRDYLLKS